MPKKSTPEDVKRLYEEMESMRAELNRMGKEFRGVTNDLLRLSQDLDVVTNRYHTLVARLKNK
ncbi:Spo0E family sporulation regulatory protein-aspartic acid phosphatase [Paenibacillus agilis]|nr:Spo0E family sporulation regulatory protein-aspartic acid phosphatase [Paenibacillus agilis]